MGPCVPWGQVVSGTTPWLVVGPLRPTAGRQNPEDTIRPGRRDLWCVDCAQAWLDLNLVAVAARGAAGVYWGALVGADAPRLYETDQGFAYRLRPAPAEAP